MKRFAILILIIYLAFPAQLWAAAYTASVSGNWNDAATWGGSGPPLAADTATINKGIRVNVFGNISSAGITIGANAGAASGVAFLNLSSNSRLTMTGDLTIGNGTSADGGIDFGPDSTLAHGSNQVILGNCRIISHATSGHFSKSIGSGNWVTSGTVTSPKQEIVLSYHSFQDTGTILFALKSTTGGSGITEQFNLDHCAADGLTSMTFGTGASGTLNITRRITNSDFRNFTGAEGLFIAGPSGTPLSPVVIDHNTFANTVNITNVRVNNLLAPQITNNTLDYWTYGVSSAATGYGGTWEHNFHTHPDTATSGSNMMILSASGAAHTITGDYFYAAYPNPHQINASGSGGSGTMVITGSVFETVYNGDAANDVMFGVINYDIYKNLQIGSGSICNNVGTKTGGTVNCYNNTTYNTYNIAEAGGTILMIETGLFTGTVNNYNNLTFGSVTSSYQAKNLAAGEQALNTVGYNDNYNITTAYKDVGTSLSIADDQRSHDISVDPQVVDSSRKLAKWNLSRGSGTDSAADGITYLLGINGYNSSTKTQSNTPSVNGPADLVSWVRAGFVPQNPALDGTGLGGVDIGAMDVQLPAASSPTIMMGVVF